MELDRVAKDIVLQSLRESLPSRWLEKANEVRRFSDTTQDLNLNDFLSETGYALTDIYTGKGDKQGWSNLLEAAGSPVLASGEHEKVLRTAISRIIHIDDEFRICWYLDLLERNIDLDNLSLKQRRMLKMLLAVLFDSVKRKDYSLEEALDVLYAHPQVVAELKELLGILSKNIDHIHHDLSSHPNIPLVIHSRYSRHEIIAAFGVGDDTKTRSRPWREGVLWIEPELTDVFTITLDKSSGNFSPTTRYRDYAISRDEMHWESQSNTRATSPTGIRYQNHLKEGSSVMLFARERTEERGFWFLGPATYIHHQSEQPMEIKWRLEVPMPGDLFSVFAAAIA